MKRKILITIGLIGGVTAAAFYGISKAKTVGMYLLKYGIKQETEDDLINDEQIKKSK